MTHELSVRAPILPPTSTTRPMADLIARFTNKLEDRAPSLSEGVASFGRKIISASDAPGTDELAVMLRRRIELLQSLRATPGEEAEVQIEMLLAMSPAYGMSERETLIRVKLYAEAVADMPTWAITAARKAFSRPGWKSSWDGRGTPSPANLVEECRAVLQPIEAELFRLNQVLDAELVDIETTPAERELALAKWAEIRSTIRKTNNISEMTPDELARERANWSAVNARFDDEPRQIPHE